MRTFLAILILATSLNLEAGEFLTWTDVQGYKMEAQLLSSTRTHATFLKKDGQTYEVPLDRFHASDRALIVRKSTGAGTQGINLSFNQPPTAQLPTTQLPTIQQPPVQQPATPPIYDEDAHRAFLEGTTREEIVKRRTLEEAEKMVAAWLRRFPPEMHEALIAREIGRLTGRGAEADKEFKAFMAAYEARQMERIRMIQEQQFRSQLLNEMQRINSTLNDWNLMLGLPVN